MDLTNIKLDVSYSAYIVVKFYAYNSTSNFDTYVLVEFSFAIWTTISQPSCKVFTTVQVCEHLAQHGTILSQPYKVTARLLQPINIDMGVLGDFCFTFCLLMSSQLHI